jgi:hypothetical protein
MSYEENEVPNEDAMSISDTEEDPICEEIGKLIAHCQELHLHHHRALDTLKRIHELLDTKQNRIIHYQCEDHDFGTLLESLHQESLNAIDREEDVNFSRVLLDVLYYSSFQEE